ncbi:MAG: hypothetical protein GY737_21475 [Desulfobacteraceae bacterium]|nr:hypothetical protein [Desulfobacteraceae bacterium]
MEADRTLSPWNSESAAPAPRHSMGAYTSSSPCGTKDRTIIPQSFTKIHLLIRNSGPMEGKTGTFPYRSADRGDDFYKYELDRHAGITTSAGSNDQALTRSSRPGPITELENKQRASLNKKRTS